MLIFRLHLIRRNAINFYYIFIYLFAQCFFIDKQDKVEVITIAFQKVLEHLVHFT